MTAHGTYITLAGENGDDSAVECPEVAVETADMTIASVNDTSGPAAARPFHELIDRCNS
jgi:hypothetical protein